MICSHTTAVQSLNMLSTLQVGIIQFLLLSVSTAAQQVLPQPQLSSAEGKLAPDFTLKDEHGKTFHLASTRGQRVLLIFFRGYW